ncbi:hypothetical protein N431DRAFT_87199 [Stipitochalara longipes BDJ]|nr:hypothetical protein N431DRAFT_87199 [Stipitochalara longipes BDJ]
MAATDLINFVIIYPDPSTIASWITFTPQRVPTNISFSNEITADLQTLSTNDADADGLIEGFLYVPDIDSIDPCFDITKSYVPATATRRKNLPDVNYNLIALAPWVSANCAKAYLAAAHSDPIQGFVFYLPNNDTNQPPPISNPAWCLNDGGIWKSETPYPVYAVPGYLGVGMMTALSNYSGNVSSVPFGTLLLDEYHLDPRDYVRIYTEIDLSSSSSSSTSSKLPGLWVFFFIVVGGLVIIASTSLGMHWVQWRRLEALRRRVASGDVELEALGLKRLAVPQNIIDKMPLFIYSCSADDTRAAEKPAASTDIKDDSGVERYSSSSTDDPVRLASLTTHDYLPHSQPTCPICLDDFVSGSTTIRELPCLHVFHPECIDSFLSNHSSLCPMCKKSTLPLGYCPAKITNAMVTRERAIRRLRESNVSPLRMDPNDTQGGDGQRSTLQNWRAAVNRGLGRAQPEIRNPPPEYTGGVAVEMQPVIDIEGPRPREVYPHMSRADIAQIRARELLGRTDMEENDGSVPRSGWQRIAHRIFPGFK